LSLFLFLLLLLFLCVDIKSFFGDTLQLLAVIFLELLDSVLVNWVTHVDNFISLLLETLNEWRVGYGLAGFSSDVEKLILSFLHAADIGLKRDHIVSTL